MSKLQTPYSHNLRGCVTPKVLQNINGSIEGNYDLLDGYEDLPEGDQEKVRKALEDGHVDDDDFNGVS